MTPKMGTMDVFLILGLTFLSFLFHLWSIQHPQNVIFDEVYFGGFTNSYIHKEFYYDIHPPLGKIIMYLVAYISEYPGHISFEGDYGKPYLDEWYVTLRITPAFFSSLCTPLIYLVVRFSGFSLYASLAASGLVCFETSMLTEHRFILSDGMLHFFSALHLCILSYGMSLDRDDFYFKFFMILSGITLGAASSCKNTAWGLIPLTAIVHAFDLYQHFKSFSYDYIYELIIRGLMFGIPTISVYIFSFCAHFALLPYIGPARNYLNDDMKSQFIFVEEKNLSLWGKRVHGKGLVYRSIALTIRMHKGNMGITQWHPYQSRPIGWPLLTDIYVGFWKLDKMQIICIGNAFSYYLGFLGIIGIPFGFRKSNWYKSILFTIGWCFSYFPFFLIPRTMYLYHYHIPLMIACCSYGVFIDLFMPDYLKGFSSSMACFLAFVGFILWSSFCFGGVSWDQSVIFWNDNWKNGDSYHRMLQRGGAPETHKGQGVQIVE